jgi:hypothetical protein
MSPLATSPELLALIAKARAQFEAMSPAERAAMLQAQRRSWVRGELMLEHPDMSAQEADALIDKAMEGGQ